MGEVLGKNISKLSISLWIVCMLFLAERAEASYREFQLFDHAYHCYLSYQPEQAIEQFKEFLAEFPDSSAKDAALFWLAKSFLQVQSIGEAKKTFSDIQQTFPESPFLRYVKKEMVSIGSSGDVHHSMKIRGKTEERNGSEGNLELTDILLKRIEKLEQKEKYIVNSSVVLNSLGIDDVPWRSNNIIDDIENEEMLYQEATRLNTTADKSLLSTLAEMHRYNDEQADYLNRYLVICRFLTTVLHDVSDERNVEVLTVDYKTITGTEKSAFDTFVLASELQTYARNGIFLGDIHALYPGETKYERVRMSELEGRIQEKISDIQDDGTGVFWTEKGFLIIRVIFPNFLCYPIEYSQLPDKNTIRTFIKGLAGERKREKHADAIQEER